MNINLKYIHENYYEFDEICKLCSISDVDFTELIQNKLIPNASYTIETTHKVTSPLNDETQIKETKKYFPKHIVRLVNAHKNLTDNSHFKKEFKELFKMTLEKASDKSFAYENIDLEKLDTIFKDEWNAYLQGIYGVCTLNATADEIIKKEIAVKKLIAFNTKYTSKKLNSEEKKHLEKLNIQFNSVSNLFAPYQRENSSRGKYLDKILTENSLEFLIKNYK